MKKKVSSSAWMCPPSTSASVMTITLPYLIPDKSTSSSMECGSTPIAVAIACNSLLASTVRLSLDMVFSTLPRSGSTACVSLSRASFAEPQLEGVAHAHLEQLGGVARGQLFLRLAVELRAHDARREREAGALPQVVRDQLHALGREAARVHEG